MKNSRSRAKCFGLAGMYEKSFGVAGVRPDLEGGFGGSPHSRVRHAPLARQGKGVQLGYQSDKGLRKQ